MKPIFKIGSHDYTAYVQDLSPVENDIDASGSGRNLLDGKMYRTRIATKYKISIKFLKIPEAIMKTLAEDLDADFVQITWLRPKTNVITTEEFYNATLTCGVQRYNRNNGICYYEGATIDITQR